MQSKVLIQELVTMTVNNSNDVKQLTQLSFDKLNYKKDKDSWSILECIEHLNAYGRFYIPEIKHKIEVSNYEASVNFKTGVLGNYFAKSMLPKEKLNKMKTFKNMNPNNSKLDVIVLDEFLTQQKEILETARKVCLTKTTTAISISKLIKLRLGDTFRVVIYHNLRHIVQAKKMM